ncbi:patatin-like phospholipase family protein [Roseovarius sp. 2305UL8-3]|uniref:patatin-like phospholipase family protein n=1 Tax=Roseovarius conchicola TaxID=3121636 RepID=UPI0035288FAB
MPRTRLKHLAICVFVLGIGGCAYHDRTAIAVPEPGAAAFHPVGMPRDIRVYGDEFGRDTAALISEYRARVGGFPKDGGLNILALSGGGAGGAYGAGVLAGWSATGSRPDFDMVTGISTGAIIAPFAFLGQQYDPALERFYTRTQTRQIARFRILRALIDGGYVADTAPLAAAIARELNDNVIADIGREAAKGRDLFVGTTNIDSERPVIWDIGRMAQIGTPEANALIRRVILASASIPVLFEPIAIEVSDGKRLREELHVDGGLTQQVFVYPVEVPMKRLLRDVGLANRDNTIWVIQNKSIYPRYEPQNTRLPRLVERTVSLLIKSQTVGDIGQIVALARRDGFSVNTLILPKDFSETPTELFDPVYMAKLYQVGLRDGREDRWDSNLTHYLE